MVISLLKCRTTILECQPSSTCSSKTERCSCDHAHDLRKSTPKKTPRDDVKDIHRDEMSIKILMILKDVSLYLKVYLLG